MPEPRPVTVEIERKGVGLFELRGHFFDVRVDGKGVATLARYGDKATFQLEPGTHTLQIKDDRFSSREIELETFEGGTLRFRTHGPMMPPRWLFTLFFPEYGINLHRA